MALPLPSKLSTDPATNAEAMAWAGLLTQELERELAALSSAGGGAVGVVQQGARDTTVQAWFIDHNGVAQPIFDSDKVVDNAPFTDGTTKLQPSGYVLDEVAGTALAENDAAAARIDSKRAQVLVVEDGTTRGRRAIVTAAGAQAVDGSGVTQPVDASGAGLKSEVLEDAADAGGHLSMLAAGVRNDAAAVKTSADGDYGNLALDSAGRVGVADLGGAISVDDNAGSLTVDGTVSVSGAVDTELETPAALGDGQTNPTLPRVGGMAMAWNGLSWDRVRCVSAGGLRVAGNTARASASIADPVIQGGRSASYPTKPASVAAGQVVDFVADLEGVQLVRPRQLATYVAIYRLALVAASSSLAFTFVANTDKQLATVYHANTATKRVTIRRVWVQILKTGAVAGELQLELRQLSATTAPATGNPAITPGKRDSALAAAEATALALPGTAGSEVAANSPIASWIGNLVASMHTVFTTGTVVPSDLGTIVLYDEASADDEEIACIMRVGIAEGWAVVGRSTAAIPLNFIVRIVFTEE